MSFVARGASAPVTLAVIAFGASERLDSCLASIVSHESATSFDVIVVANPAGREDAGVGRVPHGVEVLAADINLGWAGGLHLARHATDAEFLAWIQDDSELLPGWLDAMMEAASAHPRGAAFGVVPVSDDGVPNGHSGGHAGPGQDPGTWNANDPTPEGVWPAGVERRDWVTSKGLVVRLAAWDEVGGPCAGQYPLNHVDKEFCTHLRAHGWENYVVPGARVTHLLAQSAPGLFRQFLPHWQTQPFIDRWHEVVQALADAEGPVDHECHLHPTMAEVEAECAWHATRMLVPFSRFAASYQRDRVYEAVRDAGAVELAARVAELETRVAGMERSTSWRLTAPLRAVMGRLRSR